MIASLHHVPTAAEMIDREAPELAILAALDTTLRATVVSLLVANPELLRVDPSEQYESYPSRVWIADTLVAEARSLRTIIARYRHAIEVATACARDDQDIDF